MLNPTVLYSRVYATSRAYPSRTPGEQVLQKRCSLKGQEGNAKPATAEARKPRIKCWEYFRRRHKSTQLAVRNRAQWRGAGEWTSMADVCNCFHSWTQYKGPVWSSIACFMQVGWATGLLGLQITGCACKALKDQSPVWPQKSHCLWPIHTSLSVRLKHRKSQTQAHPNSPKEQRLVTWRAKSFSQNSSS